jgi:hypothetical protein
VYSSFGATSSELAVLAVARAKLLRIFGVAMLEADAWLAEHPTDANDSTIATAAMTPRRTRGIVDGRAAKTGPRLRLAQDNLRN